MTAVPLTRDQQRALQLVQSGCNVLILGSSGTGKTTLIKAIIDYAHSVGKEAKITASTGLAALLLPGGRTIHSLLRIPRTGINDVDYSKKAEEIKNADMLIIDEISMIGSRLIPYLYECLHAAGHDIQLILVGDFFQLPPVKDDYAFTSEQWPMLQLSPCVLTEVIRQQDEEMIWNIDQIKYGNFSHFAYFRNNSSKIKFENQTTITARKDEARVINEKALDALPGEVYTYIARCNTDLCGWEIPAEPSLTLKVGSRVMSIVNSCCYKNGSLGTVAALNEDEIAVKLDSGMTRVVQRYGFSAPTNDGDTTTTVWQFPLIPAHAITIHKSQGQSFDTINIDGASCWAPGQLYVAVSRARRVQGIHFLSEITEKNVCTDLSVINYYRSLGVDCAQIN